MVGLGLAATTVALRRIRGRDVVEHRRWMGRSYALALVFVTFWLSHPPKAGARYYAENVTDQPAGSQGP